LDVASRHVEELRRGRNRLQLWQGVDHLVLLVYLYFGDIKMLL